MLEQADFKWTEEAVEVLRAHWASGISCSQIATAMGGGLSRNAIIGKVRRLKLPKRLTSGVHTTSHQRADARAQRQSDVRGIRQSNGRGQPKANAIMAKLAARREGPANPIGPHGLKRSPPMHIPEPFDMEDGEGVDVTHLVGILDLERRSCRWPVTGEGSATMFCGQHSNHGPYCPQHSQRAGIGYGKGAR